MNIKPSYETLEQRIAELEQAQSDRRKTEDKLKKHVYLLQNLNTIDQIIRSGTDAKTVLGQMLDAILDMFGCDRAWLLYPCDPDAPSWSVPIERTRKEYPGASKQHVEIPMTQDAADAMVDALQTSGPIHGTLKPGEPEYDRLDEFDIRSYMFSAIHPKVGKPWEFGLHQCSHERTWTELEISLFKEISNRIEDTLSLLLMLRDLKESESKYRSIMQSMDEGAFICTKEHLISYMNPAMVQMVGRDATGQLCYKAIHNLDAPCDWCRHAKVMKGEKTNTEVFRSEDNRTYYVSHVPIFHGDGNVSQLSIYRDVSDIKQMEARLLQSQKMEAIGTLAGGIAHDFNNILTGIFGFSQLAQKNLDNPVKAAEDIDNVIKGAQKATELVQQILTVSRKSTHMIQPLSVYHMVKESLKLLRASIPSTIRIETRLWSKATIMADPAKIHQVIMNLCTNAYHAMLTAGGTLTVALDEVRHPPEAYQQEKADTSYKFLVLEVIDTGHGIDNRILDKIFEPYFTTKKPDKGTGLGLAVVFGIVKEYKGHLDVQSEPGRGTRFRVYLPAVNTAAAPHRNREMDDPISGTETILLVDDETDLLESSDELFRMLGYSVKTCESGRQALDIFKANPDGFDIVITDMTMPGITGLELSKKILELRSGQPIVICTGHSELINREKALAAGISEYYEKPVIIDRLAKIVRSVLDRQKEENLRQSS